MQPSCLRSDDGIIQYRKSNSRQTFSGGDRGPQRCSGLVCIPELRPTIYGAIPQSDGLCARSMMKNSTGTFFTGSNLRPSCSFSAVNSDGPEAASEATGFITLETRIITTEKQAFQTLCLMKDVSRYSLPFDCKKLAQSIDRGCDTPVDQWVLLGQLDIVYGGVNTSVKALNLILPFTRERLLQV